jgi:putative oxidoreductase
VNLTSFLGKYCVSPLPVPQSWYAVPLRIIVGYGFVEHGYAKLVRGPGAFIGILHAIGMPFAHLFGWATILVEILGGLLILLGAFVPLTAAPMIIRALGCHLHGPSTEWIQLNQAAVVRRRRRALRPARV